MVDFYAFKYFFVYLMPQIAPHKQKEKIMIRKLLQLLKIVQLVIFLPFEIASTGSKKRAYRRIKKMLVNANLL